MRISALILAAITVSSAVLSFARADSPPTTVTEFDATKYTGLWYQLADFPQFYELLTCKDCVTAQYSLNADGSVNVLNQGLGPNNCTTKGVATVPDPSKPGQLNVKFQFFPSWFPASLLPQYWILEVGPVNDEGLYSWALVSKEDRGSCYILSRTPSVDDSLMNELEQKLADQGFDLSKLRITDQSCNLNQ
jgi:apolipoprotein D and lipocalin family protein